MHRLALVAAIAVLATSVSHGQTADSTRHGPRVIGVFDSRTGEPVAGVEVRDVFSGTYSLTTASGAASLTFITFRGAAGVVELRKIGYAAKQLLVSNTDTTWVTAILEPAVTLAPVVTTEKYRIDRDAGTWAGFEQRCQSKSVTCIRNDELERHPLANMADFLIHAEGMTIGACGGGTGRGRANRASLCGKVAMRPATIPPSYCQPTFFIDGLEWNSRGGDAVDLVPGRPPEAPIIPSNVKAIEVYSTEKTRPLRFTGDPQCGAVVIWTK